MEDALTIAFFNPAFRTWPTAPERCSTPAVFTHERDAVATADALVFHLPTLDQRAFNDKSGRKPYAAQLAGRIWIDSYGSVGSNREERIERGRKHELALYGQYKFTLAFENSFAPDYVTEKFWHPLAAGSVPVYRGTADVAEFAPAAHCYIDARNFSSATELGAYLDHLDRHDDEYAAFHAWRRGDVSAPFKALLARLEEPVWCRLAAAVAPRRSRRPRGFGHRRR